MLETLRPRLTPGARFRLRGDGSAGVWDPHLGHALEVAIDEAALLGLLDGSRSLTEIAEAHAGTHGYVPFTALRDLLRTLGREGLLANPRAELEAAGLTAPKPRLLRWADRELGGFCVPPIVGLVLGTFGFILAMTLATFGASADPEVPVAADVLYAYLGAALALSIRGMFRAGAVAAGDQYPQRVRLVSCFGILHVEVDGKGLVMLDRPLRALAHVSAIAGAGAAAVATVWRPGAFAGAVAVLVFDLVPFEPTSLGKLLGVLAGRVDLREHARAYLTKRLLTRVTSTSFFEGELSLVTTTLLSLAWFWLVIQILFGPGLVAVLTLLKVGIAAEGLERAVAYLGSLALALAMPAAVIGLVWALVRAGLSLRPVPESASGQVLGTALPVAELQSISIFSHLDGPHLQAVASAVKETRYAAGEVIVTQGEQGDRFFAIRQGYVKVEQEQDSGLARELSRLGPGDCFGETALLHRVPRTATVRATSDVVVATLSAADFQKVRETLGDVDVTRLLRATAALHKSRFFDRLGPDRLSTLALKLEPRTVPAGTIIVRQGESGSELFLVGTGKLEVLDGSGAAVATLGPGDHFGEIALLRDIPRTATVRASEEAMVLALRKDAFIKAMAADLNVSERVEELAAERAQELRS